MAKKIFSNAAKKNVPAILLALSYHAQSRVIFEVIVIICVHRHVWNVLEIKLNTLCSCQARENI